MKQKIRLLLMLALAGVFLFSVGMMVRQQLEYRNNAKLQEGAALLARFEPPEWTLLPDGVQQTLEEDVLPLQQALEAIDLAALQEENPDVTGWIYLPGTELSYPLVCGTDNSFYLTHSWDRTRNSCGSIFFDYRCAPDFSGFNTIIYGHRMRDDSMFGTLKYFKDTEFWKTHPTLYIVDSSGVRVYDIFAAWEPDITGVVYSLDYAAPEKRQEFLNTCLSESQLDTGLIPGPEDHILTLSTCTGSGHATRWVVQAVERSGTP